MKRIVLLICVTLSCVVIGVANNVRIEEQVVVVPEDVDDKGIATVR